jgi:hypothetical protein
MASSLFGRFSSLVSVLGISIEENWERLGKKKK